jgi:hypothetical protein
MLAGAPKLVGITLGDLRKELISNANVMNDKWSRSNLRIDRNLHMPGLLTQGGQGGRPAPLASRFHRIPIHSRLDLHGI